MARYRRPSNDRLSPAFADIVPPNYRGSDRFLDVVTWNIRYFHHRDKKRLSRVIEILSALNADIFVLQEILEDSLEPVAEGLDKKGAGYYVTAYGRTGGNQRIAVLYDLDWIRSKDDIRELFGKGQVRASDGKDAFPRLPLWCNFTSLSHEGAPFDFQLLGVHLKSQRGGGGPQRQKAAGALANWLRTQAPKIDSDVLILGDWNEPPDASTWRPLHRLEKAGKALFATINKKHEISHLMYRNKQEIGSRLDLNVVSVAAKPQIKDNPQVVRWKSLDELLKKDPKAAEIKKYIREVSQNISDHMPVVTRFYFEEDAPSGT